MISPRTKAILAPNLIGNAPDWDRIRAIADAHGLKVVEDSCDALGATLRGTPTGTRSDISVTSFALAHIITAAGTGGMVLLDDDELDRPLPAPAPVGPPLGAAVLRDEEGRPPVLHRRRRHRVRQPLHLRRGRLELRAVRDQRRVRDRAAPTSSRRTSPGASATSTCCPRSSAPIPDVFTLPRQLEGLETGWHMFPILIRPESGIRRADFQEHMEGHGIDTRMVWTGNVTRQPAFADRAAPGAGGWAAQRRPGDGAGADPAVEPRARRRRPRVPVRHRRRVPEGTRLRRRAEVAA